MSCTNSAEKLWALVDCNSFYCSCERLFRPDLYDRPVVVLSNNDGCLIALTPEAKALGFVMGDVYFEIAHKLIQHKVAVFSSNYTLYGDISRRVMGAMASVAGTIEQYSIDEAFVPLSGALVSQAEDVGWAIHDRVRQWVGVPVRVGIGPTRTLAKLANHWAKRKSRVYRLEADSQELETVLEETPVGDIWGIGRRLSKKLALQGIRNARQLRDMDVNRALKLLTVTGQRTVYELCGLPAIMEDTAPVPRKTLVSSRSFGRGTTRLEDLSEALAMHAGIAGERLRKEKVLAASITVWCETSRHGEEPYHCISASKNFGYPTNNTMDIAQNTRATLESCYQKGYSFMKGGIMLFNLAEEGERQLTLMESILPPESKQRQKVMQTMDTINKRYGRDTLRLASQGRQDATWRMRRGKMSPYYTTKFSDLPKVKA